MKSYTSPKTIKGKKSKINGRGIFAISPIKKGELIAIKTGHILTNDVVEVLEKQFKTCPFQQITDDFYMGPLSIEELEDNLIFFNHSCNPNMGVQGQVVFVAMRDIKTGEEITVDYATMDTSVYELHCHCGSKLCRKVITGNDWKKLDLQKKYQGFFSTFIQDKIDSLKK